MYISATLLNSRPGTKDAHFEDDKTYETSSGPGRHFHLLYVHICFGKRVCFCNPAGPKLMILCMGHKMKIWYFAWITKWKFDTLHGSQNENWSQFGGLQPYHACMWCCFEPEYVPCIPTLILFFKCFAILIVVPFRQVYILI